MKRIFVAIIGGGVSGLTLAVCLSKQRYPVAIFERGERVGKKLSATGNGQGNLTNAVLSVSNYFSQSKTHVEKAKNILSRYDNNHLQAFMQSLGVLSFADEKGRIYPTSRQASSITDALRFAAEKYGVETYLQTQITNIQKTKDGFILSSANEQFFAENVVVCTGGKAAKNFGTDGAGYRLAESLGHSVTALTPSLVQLKTDTQYTKTLKGIRVVDGLVTARYQGEEKTIRGDIIFTDYGVSGDAIFRISAFIADKIQTGATLFIDFLPTFTSEELYHTLIEKTNAFPDTPLQELLSGIVNNQIGRAVYKRAVETVGSGDIVRGLVNGVKQFALSVKGTLGFDYAQVTKGGVSFTQVDENLQSTLCENVYFAGEILDIDGECGGYNVQWAYSSACAVADAIMQKNRK